MHLNINDLSLWPAGMGELHFTPSEPTARGAECFAIRAGEAQKAELERCDADAWVMCLEHGEEVSIAIDEAWDLEVCDARAHRSRIAC
jgi:hypothetical protein